MSNSIKYGLYSILIYGFLIGSQLITDILRRNAAETFQPLYAVLFFCLTSLVLGAILGLEHFIKENSKQGKWIAEKEKLIIVGLPALILYIYFFFCFFDILYVDFLCALLKYDFEKIVGVIFGYVLITSFRKND